MKKESQRLSLPVQEPLDKEELHVLKNNELEIIYGETEYADEDADWNNRTRYFFVISLLILTGMFFTALYIKFDGSCSLRFFIGESSILNKEDIIKPELDPCDDFYSFACGRWNNSASYNNNFKSVIEETQKRNLLRLECYLKHSSIKTLNPWSKFVKKTYDFCEMGKDYPIYKSKTVAFVKTAAAPLIFNGYNQSGMNYVLHRVHHKYLQNGLFSWDVTLDVKDDETIQAVRMKPPKKIWNGDVPFTSRQHLIEYMKDILSLLGAEKESLQSKCEDTADFILLLQIVTNKTRSKTRQQVMTRKLITYRELIKGFDFIDLNEYFRDFLLPESLPVVVEDPDYFIWLKNHINKAEKRSAVIQNFLYWSLIDFFVPYMPKAFGEARDKYANKLGGKVERRHACLNAVKNEMNFAVSSFFMDKVLDDKSRGMASNLVNDIALHVKNSFRDSLHSLQNPNDNSRKWFSGLEGVLKNIEIGIPTYLRDIYNDNLSFVPMDDSFPSYYIAGTKFVKEKMLGYIHDKAPLAVFFLLDFIEVNAIFLTLPQVVMNVGILTPPIFHPRQPLPVNYAGLGFVLSHELAHSTEYLAIDDTSVMANFKLKLGCLHKQYGETKPLSHVIVEEDFADNIGVKIAYKAYLEHASRHYKFKKVTLKERKMFFLHFSQLFCEDGSSFGADENEHHSPYKHRVNIPLSNLPDFSETFSCPKGSKMNNENRCLI